jgi:hypothetical protein
MPDFTCASKCTKTETFVESDADRHRLQAEPFFSKEEVVVVKHVKDGMEVQGGAAPVMPVAASHPNHHLVVHVFRKRGRQAMRQ